jgi:hypothetical protein
VFGHRENRGVPGLGGSPPGIAERQSNPFTDRRAVGPVEVVLEKGSASSRSAPSSAGTGRARCPEDDDHRCTDVAPRHHQPPATSHCTASASASSRPVLS